jgi:hypothetical protein
VPKFKQNKKRIDPRYFLNEKVDTDLSEKAYKSPRRGGGDFGGEVKLPKGFYDKGGDPRWMAADDLYWRIMSILEATRRCLGWGPHAGAGPSMGRGGYRCEVEEAKLTGDEEARILHELKRMKEHYNKYEIWAGKGDPLTSSSANERAAEHFKAFQAAAGALTNMGYEGQRWKEIAPLIGMEEQKSKGETALTFPEIVGSSNWPGPPERRSTQPEEDERIKGQPRKSYQPPWKEPQRD